MTTEPISRFRSIIGMRWWHRVSRSWLLGALVVMWHLCPIFIMAAASWTWAHCVFKESGNWTVQMHLVAGNDFVKGKRLIGNEVKFDVKRFPDPLPSNQRLVYEPSEVKDRYALRSLEKNTILTNDAVGSFEKLLKTFSADSILVPIQHDLATSLSRGLKVQLRSKYSSDMKDVEKQKRIKNECTVLFSHPRELKAVIEPPTVKEISLLALDGKEEVSSCFSVLDYKEIIPLPIATFNTLLVR